jgi:hypothetical protein
LEQAETVRGTLRWSALSPNLERRISLCSVPIIQIERIKNEKPLSLSGKDPAE